MSAPLLDANHDATHGVRLRWLAPHFNDVVEFNLRVLIRGQNTFCVWGIVDSGEAPPVWSEKDLNLTFFGPDQKCLIEKLDGSDGRGTIHIGATTPRASVDVSISLRDDQLSIGVTLHAPVSGPALPVCYAEILLDEIPVGVGARYLTAHSYGGRTHPAGVVADAVAPGIPAIHGCIGLALPLVCLHQPVTNTGLAMEFMLSHRPTAWIRRGGDDSHAALAVSWTLDRLIAPGDSHRFGGDVRLNSFRGSAVQQLRDWRDHAGERYGLIPPPAPEWIRRANIIEFNMNPQNTAKGFTRLDDPKCREMLIRWHEMGYTAMFAVSCNNVGLNWLSPFDYRPSPEVGGAQGERQFLTWAREIGFGVFLWVTTVGIDRNAPEVAAHPEWFTHRADGSLFYAWDSGPSTKYIGYAPDGDPLSTGWRDWLKSQVREVIERGYKGIFVDGLIPRASNHARFGWPGEGRNGVEDQTRELANFVRTLGPDLITFVEDESVVMQASAEMTNGRYTASTPFVQKPFWDHGMGGGPAASGPPPRRIAPEEAREYLLIRYASHLPGVLSNDILEGYYSESDRPWTAQSLLAGMVPKTHSQYVDDPMTFRLLGDAVEVPEAERAAENRLRGHAEFLSLLKFCRDEPLIRTSPLSIEGVEVEGERAVVGIIRPASDRCILAVINFASRAATVRVRLVVPIDIPRSQRQLAGDLETGQWLAVEVLSGKDEQGTIRGGILGARQAMSIQIGPFGFRVFELSRAGSRL